MRIIPAASEFEPKGSNVCLAIGFFDGVHLGHQQIIRQTITDAAQHRASALVVTFDQHPNAIVAPARVPSLIYSVPQKLRTIESLGANSLLLAHFDKAFSEQTGEAFILGLSRELGHIRSLCVGANFAFGHKRGGNVELLKKMGSELGFTVHGMAAVSLDGEPVSSTRIRQCINAGELDAASQMLGRAYSLAGQVERGDQLGRKLGFPTANLDVTGLALPPNGVYAVLAQTGGKSCRAVANIGIRPTVQSPNPARRVEAHLIEFAGDLYGQEIVLTFVEKLRDEQKFASLDELKVQIARDIHEAEALL